MSLLTEPNQLVVGLRYKINNFVYWLQRLDVEQHRCGKTTVDLQFRSAPGDLELVGEFPMTLNLTMEGAVSLIMQRLQIHDLE